MLFQGKNDAFLRNTANKHRVINVILTELKKPEFNAFHLYEDTDIDITKLRVKSSLKCLITETSENKDLLVLLLYHADHNSKLLYFKKVKQGIKTILRSDIHAKLPFLYALTGCDTNSSISGIGKSTEFF